MRKPKYEYKALEDSLLSFQWHIGDSGRVEILVTSNLDDELDKLFGRGVTFAGDINPFTVGGQMLNDVPLKNTDERVLSHLDQWMKGYLKKRGYSVVKEIPMPDPLNPTGGDAMSKTAPIPEKPDVEIIVSTYWPTRIIKSVAITNTPKEVLSQRVTLSAKQAQYLYEQLSRLYGPGEELPEALSSSDGLGGDK